MTDLTPVGAILATADALAVLLDPAVMGAILATADALAALVDPAVMLPAWERAGKVTYESCETESFYRLTDPRPRRRPKRTRND